jgi:hypothetical protein
MTSHDGNQGRPKQAGPNQAKEQKVKSLKFFKPTLATTLAMVLASLLSVRPAQAGYTVTLQQVGPDVVATGSGAIDLRGLSSVDRTAVGGSFIRANDGTIETGGGPVFFSGVDRYWGPSGPTSFGSGSFTTFASSYSGDRVGMHGGFTRNLTVPRYYVSGTALSDTATYSGTTLATLGVTPGTYVWSWGTRANQNFTLQIAPATTPKITKFSTRASVQTGQGVTIARFTVTGTESKQVLIRGLGPTLTQHGVSGALADPVVTLMNQNGNVILANNNWKNTQQEAIQATRLAPANDLEAAILATVPAGKYTVILSGKNGTTGIGLVEVYDLATGALAELTKVSTRGFVGTDQAVMIGGFILSEGNGSTQILVRGLGPTLTERGVSGALADPALTLVDSNGNIVRRNNNWKDSQQAAIQATGLAPANDLEAAILATVPAGNYTVIVSGKGGGTGIGLVEVYKLQ